MLLFKRLIFPCLLLLNEALAAQSPWVRGKNEWYAQLGANLIAAQNKLFASGGRDYLLNRDVRDATFQLYGEYGLSPRLTATLDVPFKSVATSDEVNPDGFFQNQVLPAGSLHALGNVSAALKYGFKTPFPLAATVQVSAPTGQRDAATGLQTGYDAWSAAPSLSAGKGWRKAYVFAVSGVTFRSNAYSPDWFGQAEAGYRLGKLYVIGVLDLRQSFLGGGHDDGTVLQTGLYANNQSYLAYGLKFSLALTRHLGVNLSGYGASAGNLVQASPSLGVSVYYKK